MGCCCKHHQALHPLVFNCPTSQGGISREEAARKRAKGAVEGAGGKDTSGREANKVAAVGSVLQGMYGYHTLALLHL
jgi:hypothetical protein